MAWNIGGEEPENTQRDGMWEGSRGRRTASPGVEMYGKIHTESVLKEDNTTHRVTRRNKLNIYTGESATTCNGTSQGWRPTIRSNIMDIADCGGS